MAVQCYKLRLARHRAEAGRGSAAVWGKFWVGLGMCRGAAGDGGGEGWGGVGLVCGWVGGGPRADCNHPELFSCAAPLHLNPLLRITLDCWGRSAAPRH